MAVDVQQLQSDFEQVRQLLAQYPGITLLQTKGDPPDCYDIAYNVKGYKPNPDGTASPANRHAVRITLPFGYPHFAPTVKPLSPIFHPDIDPDAVRIADFWEKSRSLPELIIHIGQMICGAVYSTEEPFNQRASDWYQAHRSELPFDVLTSSAKGAAEVETAEEDTATGVETLFPDGSPENGNPQETGQEGWAQFPVEQQGDDFPLELELEGNGDGAPDAELEIDDWTIFQENEHLSSGDERESFGEQAEPYDPAGEPAETIDDIFDLEFESAADHGEAEKAEASTERGKPDFAGTFSAKEEASEPSAAPEAGDQSYIAAEISALELATDQPRRTDGKDRSAGRQETADSDGLEEFSLELDEDPTRRYGGPARSIQPLIEQKEIFTAKKVLADLADPDSLPDMENYRQTIAAAISEADEMYKKADKYEQNGELEKAGIILDLVANIALDYPGLELARNRIRESLMAQGQKKPPPHSPPPEKKTPGVQNEQPQTAEESAPTRKIRRQIGVRLPYRLIAAVLVLVGCAIGGYMVFTNDSKNIRLAQWEFENGRRHVQQRDFLPAQHAFDSAQSALNSILLIHRGAKHELQAQIVSITNSAEFREGLQGRVLYDGRYVSVETAKAIDQFKRHTKAAEKYVQEGQPDLAVESYEQSLLYVEPAGFQELEQDIRQAVDALRLQQTIARVGEFEAAGEWDRAADIYKKALELDGAFSSPEERQQIALRHATALFQHELDKGKEAYGASDWQGSINSLERAEKILAENPAIGDERKQAELRRLLVNSRLFHLLAAAREAYEQQHWDRAVTEYTNAVNLLDENAAALGDDEVADGRRQIERTILMTRIAREQNRLDTALRNNDREEALGQYRTIARLIDESPFKDDETLRKIYENAENRSAAVEKELLVNHRIDWLMDNFERIFREHYPSAKQSELLNPKVTFIKREGNIMIFAMSCTEKQKGRAFRLELNYQYDMDTDTWKIYSGKL
jgi:tetratricopeptide (TPR) repeat protein/ubiquitin-protein ligase